MFDLLSELGRRASASLASAIGEPGAATIPEELALSRSTRPEFGDFQIAACLQLARGLGRPPRELAALVAEALGGHPAVARAEVAGPGFVNLHLADAVVAERAAGLAGDPALGLRAVGEGRRVVIDYSSPNVAKPMHIGHIRSTILGEALKRVLRAVGYEVIGDNHLGDWGTQFGKLVVAWRRFLDEKAFEEAPVAELLRIYVAYQDEEKRQWAALGGKPAREKNGGQGGEAGEGEEAGDGDEDDEAVGGRVPEILEAARAELVKLQQGDPDDVALWRRFVDVSMNEFERVYRRLDVRFDVVLGESFYNDRLADTVATLEGRGIARESRGALAVFFDKPTDGEDLPPFLVRKADGGYNYGTTDVAGILYREERWQPARILYVTDERQQLHFRQLFAVARRLGVSASLEHVWFGLMRLPEGTFSTREGNVIGLEALLDEAERRARRVAAEHSEGLAEAELDEVARVVGIGAVKYNDLSKDRQTLVTFTWDKALSLQGNTAPYLQYAYARIRSILRKAAADEGAAAGESLVLGSPVERALAMRLLAYPEAVEQVARTLRPNVLCDYLYELATTFSAFYTELPVLKAEPRERSSRLLLAELTSRHLRHGLGLLGIETLERM